MQALVQVGFIIFPLSSLHGTSLVVTLSFIVGFAVGCTTYWVFSEKAICKLKVPQSNKTFESMYCN